MPFSRPFFRHILDYKIKDLIKEGKLTQVLSLFSLGSKAFAKDTKKYWEIHYRLSHSNNWDRDCYSLTKKELELYMTLPSDFLRVLPVLLVSALPFAQNIVFPLALAFPKKLLSSHYWTNQIKKEYLLERHLLKESYFHAAFREYQSKLSHQLRVKGFDSVKHLIAIEQKMANAQRPDVFLLINSNYAFEYPSGPYSLTNLDSIYLRRLARLHGHTNFSLGFIRKSLQAYSATLNQVDKAIAREGLASLSEKELFESCILRGFLSEDKEELSIYLDNWIRISMRIDGFSSSLLLHLPIFLSTTLPEIGKLTKHMI